jgi:phosphate acetyltransferase
MAHSLYIASLEPRSGKSIVSLGLMEMICRRIRKVAFFRPVIPDVATDNNIHLISQRYNLDLDHEDMYAFKHDQAQSMSSEGNYKELLKIIVARFKELERRHSFILCEGTDYTGVSSAFEFDFNADIANNLGTPVLVVVNGRDKNLDAITDAITVAREAFEGKGCAVIAMIVNRVPVSKMMPLKTQTSQTEGPPIYLVPEDISLSKPTMGEIAMILNAKFILGEPPDINRPVKQFVVAAMKLPNFLEHVTDDSLVITPGDRADIILGSLATNVSDTFPNVTGLLLTGGLKPEAPITRLLKGFKRNLPIPVLSVDTDTFTTAMNVYNIHPMITADNDRKIASALGLFEQYVKLTEVETRMEVVRSQRRTPIMFEYELIERAKSDYQHIVLPEGQEERILRAADILLKRKVCDLTLLGSPDVIRQQAHALGLRLDEAHLINPLTSDLLTDFAHTYFELRKHKGISAQIAKDTVTDASYFGTMMVHLGHADGMVSGSVNTTAHTIRPAFEIIKTQPECSIVSSVFFMCLADRVLVYGDCAVNPNPNADQLADIAISSSETAQMFGIDARVAMLSYSTGESGRGVDVDKVRKAAQIAKQRRPDLKLEGPIQYDAAIDMGVARTKLPGSEVAGHANVFIFPDLNTGNNTYKAVQRSARAIAIGPVLQGLNKPVNDLSRGCLVTDIVNTVAITAIQAQE